MTELGPRNKETNGRLQVRLGEPFSLDVKKSVWGYYNEFENFDIGSDINVQASLKSISAGDKFTYPYVPARISLDLDSRILGINILADAYESSRLGHEQDITCLAQNKLKAAVIYDGKSFVADKIYGFSWKQDLNTRQKIRNRLGLKIDAYSNYCTSLGIISWRGGNGYFHDELLSSLPDDPEELSKVQFVIDMPGLGLKKNEDDKTRR